MRIKFIHLMLHMENDVRALRQPNKKVVKLKMSNIRYVAMEHKQQHKQHQQQNNVLSAHIYPFYINDLQQMVIK